MKCPRRCLVTGASGFFGGHVLRTLASAGYDVTVCGRRPVPGFSFVAADLNNTLTDGLGPFDEVYHVAGLAHLLPRTKTETHAFYEVNREGTRRLLNAIDRCGQMPEAFLLISTVAVYGVSQGLHLDERTDRRAEDAYGASKRQAEDLVLEWAERRGVRPAVIRLPLVAGAGAPGNLRAMVDAIRRGRYGNIGGGLARRSMVMADDAAAVLPRAAAVGGVFHLTDGIHPTFFELSTAVATALGCRPAVDLPLWIARPAAWAGDLVGRITGRTMPMNSRVLEKMTSTLTFSDQCARGTLGWKPSPVLARAAELVLEQR